MSLASFVPTMGCGLWLAHLSKLPGVSSSPSCAFPGESCANGAAEPAASASMLQLKPAQDVQIAAARDSTASNKTWARSSEICWQKCGEKLGYCDYCIQGDDLWRACCGGESGTTSAVCDSVVPAPSSSECVAVPMQQFPDGVSWMSELEIVMLGDSWQGKLIDVSDLVCGDWSFSRISFRSDGKAVQMKVHGLQLTCIVTVTPVVLNRQLRSTTFEVSTDAPGGNLIASLMLPETHADFPRIKMAEPGSDGYCKATDYTYTWKVTRGTGDSGLAETVNTELSSKITNRLLQSYCRFLVTSVVQYINYGLTELTNHGVRVIQESQGKDCFASCGNQGGWCPFCGPGRACCRQGQDMEKPECASASNVPVDGYECVDASIPEPWFQSLVYKVPDVSINGSSSLAFSTHDIVWGNFRFDTMLVDVHDDGLSLHFTGQNFTVECSAVVSLGGAIATIHAILSPGSYLSARLTNNGGLEFTLSECKSAFPLDIKVTKSSLGEGKVVSFLLRQLSGFIFGDLCKSFGRPIENAVTSLVNVTMDRHEFYWYYT